MKLISSVVVGVMLAIAPATSGAATDTFTRTVASGWGTADFGGAWTPESGVSDFSVNGTTGRIRLAAGGTVRAAFLSGTSVDWDASANVSLDKTPTGGSAWLYHELRRAPSSINSYLLYARFANDGTTWVSASRVANGTETAIGSQVAVPGVNYRTGLTLRGQLTGTNPTTIRIKAWSGSEPTTWNYTATDSAGPQVAGRAGLRSYTSRGTTNAPLTLTIDNYAANATTPPPPPPPPPRHHRRHRHRHLLLRRLRRRRLRLRHRHRHLRHLRLRRLRRLRHLRLRRRHRRHLPRLADPVTPSRERWRVAGALPTSVGRGLPSRA